MVDFAASYRTKDGEILDEIVWRHYGNQVAGALETVLEANPGLADKGPVLPIATLVQLPVIATPKEAQSVRLWD